MRETDCGGWKLGLVLMGKPMLSKSLIQFSVDGWGCVPSLYLTWEQTMVEIWKIMVTIRRPCAGTAALSALDPAAAHCQPTAVPETPVHSQASLGQSLVGSLLLSPGSWCTQVLFVPSKSLFPQSCVSSGIKSHWPPKSNSLGFSVSLPDPQVGKSVWVLELS